MKVEIDEKFKDDLIERFRDFPVWVIALAWNYALGLNKFGVDLSKEWENVTQKRSEVDLAYRMGKSECYKVKSHTNYGCVIESPERLARFIADIADCRECEEMHGVRMCDVASDRACEDCWCGWLRQKDEEADDEFY